MNYGETVGPSLGWGDIVRSAARLKLIVTEAPREIRIPQGIPNLPVKDNEPGSVEVLLAANRWWRQNPWPQPYEKTIHTVTIGDARDLVGLSDKSVHLIVTSPPYFNIKPYESDAGGKQLARLKDYDEFLKELTLCIREWSRVLVPGGRVCCVVGDVLVPRRRGGRHMILPLPADIMVIGRSVGLDTLTPILWLKIGNRTNEAGGGSSGYYGKPYQPGAVIKNDFEHILMLRKPGAYRSTSMLQKALSMLQREEMETWQRPFWQDINGASLRDGHPAPFPVALADRLIKMFSFAGDTILDPFCGSGSTAVAACRGGRNSISLDIEGMYVDATVSRIRGELRNQIHHGAYARQLVYEGDRLQSK